MEPPATNKETLELLVKELQASQGRMEALYTELLSLEVGVRTILRVVDKLKKGIQNETRGTPVADG